jgi:histidinol-phosphate/aromatic aminotransferase/cobyric acid decarboxylase-like protein
MRISIHFNSHEEQNSQYDWVDISVGENRVGKARCMIDKSTITIHTINIYSEYEGRGYGREFVKYYKDHYLIVVADRVRPVSIGFWKTMGFVDNKDGCWVYLKILLDGEK